MSELTASVWCPSCSRQQEVEVRRVSWGRFRAIPGQKCCACDSLMDAGTVEQPTRKADEPMAASQPAPEAIELDRLLTGLLEAADWSVIPLAAKLSIAAVVVRTPRKEEPRS